MAASMLPAPACDAASEGNQSEGAALKTAAHTPTSCGAPAADTAGGAACSMIASGQGEAGAMEADAVERRDAERPALPQLVNGVGYFAEDWGMTMAQVADFIEECRQSPEWKSTYTMYDVVDKFVIPKTRGTGLGYSLLVNSAAPKRVNLMVSHAWGENALDFLQTLQRSTDEQDVLFICSFALYQCEDDAGPSIKEQLGSDAEDSPFRRVLRTIRQQGQSEGWRWQLRALIGSVPKTLMMLSIVAFCFPMFFVGFIPLFERRYDYYYDAWHGGQSFLEWAERHEHFAGFAADDPWRPYRVLHPIAAGCFVAAWISWWCLRRHWIYNGRMVVVPNREGDLYSRLWCVFEVYAAVRSKVPIQLGHTLASAGRSRSREAHCKDQRDEDSIRQMIERDVGYDQVDRTIAITTSGAHFQTVLMIIREGVPLAILSYSREKYVVGWKWTDFYYEAPAAVVSWGIMITIGFFVAKRGVIHRGYVTLAEALFPLLLLRWVAILIDYCTASSRWQALFMFGMQRSLEDTARALTVLIVGVRLLHCLRNRTFVRVCLRRWQLSLAGVFLLQLLVSFTLLVADERARVTRHRHTAVLELFPRMTGENVYFSMFLPALAKPLGAFAPSAFCCIATQRWGVQLESAGSPSNLPFSAAEATILFVIAVAWWLP